MIDLDVTSPRPLADAARVLEQRFRRVVTYEDTLYLHPDDTIRDEGGRLIPRGGRIAVQYEDSDDLQAVIDTVVEAYTRSKLPGVFAVERHGDGRHIVPRAFRNDRGVVETRRPLLDATISVPVHEHDGLRLAEEIVRRAAAAGGDTSSLGTVPTNALAQHRAATGELSGKARDLLVGLFRDMGRPYSWQLLNNPGTREFFLNIHEVPVR